MIDTMLGKYRILQRLGEGGMGTVFKARDELIDRIVAIKVLRPELANNPQLLDRFRAEAVALARLNHPRIAILHGLEQNGNELYMVMEFLPGETIEKTIKRLGRVPWPRAIEVTCEVLSALDHAHDMGVVHRDIKPANVMIAPNGSVKVMDFGIARITGRDRQTRVGHTVGTPVYMSPEQLRGEEVDGRADLYAVASMLYEMITGQVTFDAESDYDLMMKQLNEMPPSPSSLNPEVPPSLDSIVERSLAKRRDQRYVSAAAMQAALLAVLHGSGAGAATAVPPSRPTPVDLKATRLSDAASEPEARSFAPQGVANETRIAPSSAAVPLHKDWRSWVAVAAVLVAMVLVFNQSGGGGNTGGTTGGTSATPASGAAQQVAVTPASRAGATGDSASANNTGVGGTVGVPDGGPSIVRVPTGRPVEAPRDGNDPPASGDSSATTSNAPPSRTTTPARPADKPPARTTRNNTPVRPNITDTSRTTTPATRQDPVENTAPVRTTSAPITRAAATDAAASLLALVSNGNADGLASVLTSGDGRDKLFTAVRDRRASAGAPSDVNMSSDGNVSFSTTLSWRSAFGASRRGTMRISGVLSGSGDNARITRARLVELPDIK